MKLRALVIDDSRVMRNLVMTTLRRTRLAEFEFTEAEDGADGLAKFDATTDIVFADWNMPNMTGVEFARHVRAMKLEKHVPIVMITSERTSAKMDEALGSAGADAYICKPFTADDVERKLARVVAGVETKSPPPARTVGFFSSLARSAAG
ncbi:MAG: response regulator [Chloroflexota bacterium]